MRLEYATRASLQARINSCFMRSDVSATARGLAARADLRSLAPGAKSARRWGVADGA
ncbi:hypothetical protein KRR26_07115 [Corallococcus sp. M34]|uniref:hypothetical protein n=1 Tax=Citreicoccus inhibens TaxID=2849499 RepID=UPI001C23559A|nr:hypothetical protein [Citreicoccus inhibens]MBU8895368.1 hypothetical protein [Citreicoccus inhibens]